MSVRENDWRFLCQVLKNVGFRYQLKVPHKLVIPVELFYRNDILAKMSHAIHVLLSCHLNYLFLKLFFLYI